MSRYPRKPERTCDLCKYGRAFTNLINEYTDLQIVSCDNGCGRRVCGHHRIVDTSDRLSWFCSQACADQEFTRRAFERAAR